MPIARSPHTSRCLLLHQSKEFSALYLSLFLTSGYWFLQVSKDACVIDGTVDNLEPGKHGLNIHEFGDISDGCARYVF